MTQPTDIVERYTSDLERIQEGNRPLPWVVHSGCSYRRIASQPTRENGYRSFSDGNVLHAYVQRPDNHPDLSMGEEQLEALVRLINGCPDLLAEITRLRTELAEARTRGVKEHPMTLEQRNAAILKALAEQTKRNTVSPEAARAALIAEGIYTKDGHLHPNFGGPRDGADELAEAHQRTFARWLRRANGPNAGRKWQTFWKVMLTNGFTSATDLGPQHRGRSRRLLPTPTSLGLPR